MPGDFDTIKERVDIVALISERVPLKKAGKVYKGLCPFHIEKTPSFQVDPDRRNYHCFGCLPPGQLIKTDLGPRPIEAIQVGERVFARDGRIHRVLARHEHYFRGEVVELVGAPFEVPIVLTSDHLVPVVRARSGKVEIVAAGDLRPQNYLIYPIVDRPKVDIDWAALPVWFAGRGKHPKPLPSSVDLALFAEWLGWYLAEGSVSNDRTVRFSLGGDEIGVAERIRSLSEALFGERPRYVVDGSRIEMWFCHALLSRWLKHNCGEGAHTKHLPDFVWSWSFETQTMMLNALVSGDGSRYPTTFSPALGYETRAWWSLTLASPRLIDDVRDMLLRQGLLPSMRDNHTTDGRCSWVVRVSERQQTRWSPGEGPTPQPVPVRIRHVERYDYDGPVHNLTVEDDHTFLTLSGVVANCGRGGDIFTFLEELDHVDRAESLRILAERAGVELTRRSPEDKDREERLRKVMDTALFYFRQGLRHPELGKAPTAYLAQRGMSQDAIDKFQLGYAPELWDGLLNYLKKKGYSEEDGIAVGLLRAGDRRAYDWFRGRLMVPIRDSRGRTIAFGGRAMKADEPAKYVNSPNTTLFNKSATLYALDAALPAIRAEGAAVIVEGYFDVIASHQAGIRNVVASMGTALTAEQYLRLQDLKIEKVVVAFDGDPAGQRSAERRGRELLPLLQRHGGRAGAGQMGTRGYATLFVTVLPDGMDPDDLARSDPARLQSLIAGAQSLLDFLIGKIRERSRLDQSEGRLRFLDEAAAVLAAEPDPVRREVYLSTVAGSTGVDPALLRKKIETAPAVPRAPQPARPAPEDVAERPQTPRMKQTPLQERYVMALLTRFPEEIARVDLDPDDLVDPDLRALLIHLQAGDRSSSDLPAHLAAIAAALSATAQGPSEEADPGQAIEIAVQRLRVQRLRDRLEQVRAELAAAKDEDLQELAQEVDRLATEMTAAMARVERRTVLHGETERRESE